MPLVLIILRMSYLPDSEMPFFQLKLIGIFFSSHNCPFPGIPTLILGYSHVINVNIRKHSSCFSGFFTSPKWHFCRIA